MNIYQNLNGESGVVAYEIGAESIVVQFQDGSIYEYTYTSAGAGAVEAMKQLARGGVGLNSYINRNARKAYSRKIA